MARSGRVGDHVPMRATVAASPSPLSLACALSVVALAAGTKEGLPAYTDGYAGWQKLNRRPITTPGAQRREERVREQSRGAKRLFPDGTVVVKSIAARARRADRSRSP